MGPLLLYDPEQQRYSCIETSRNECLHTILRRVRVTLDSLHDRVHLATQKNNASDCDFTLELYLITTIRARILKYWT